MSTSLYISARSSLTIFLFVYIDELEKENALECVGESVKLGIGLITPTGHGVSYRLQLQVLLVYTDL